MSQLEPPPYNEIGKHDRHVSGLGQDSGSQPNPNNSSVGSASHVRINRSPSYNDVWATILFLVHLAVVITISAISLAHYPSSSPQTYNNSNGFSLSTFDSFALLIVAVGTGFVLSLIYVWLLQRFTSKIIIGSMVLSVAATLFMGLYYFALGYFFPGILMIFFAGLSAFFYYSWRDRIAFAKILLQTVVSVTKQYPAMMFTGILGLIAQTAYSVFWMIGFLASVSYFDTTQTATKFLIIYFLFSYYWVSQVVKNAVHVTIGGVFATYYFMGIADPVTRHVMVPVRNPAGGSAKRALTTSFGSICFGSLIVAIIQTARTLVRSVLNEAQRSRDNMLFLFTASCLEWILSVIDGLVQYFNVYCFAQISIYGKPFIPAAKDTWRLVKSKGIDAIINDQIIGTVLSWGTLVVGLVAGFIGYIFSVYQTSIPNQSEYQASIFFLCLFVAYMEMNVLNEVIRSGVVTTFVALAEDPEALRATKPALYQAIITKYPGIHFANIV